MKKSLIVCYVDDDIVDREIFEEVLKSIHDDVSVHLQDSGDALLDILHSSDIKPDLVFLDLNMPQKNGFDVLRSIQEMNKQDVPPVIVFTTSDDLTHVQLSKQLGASMYVEKPQHYETYVRTIQSILFENQI